MSAESIWVVCLHLTFRHTESILISTHTVWFMLPVCVQSKEAPGFGESYAADLPTFSLSPQEYIANVSRI